MQIYVGKNGQQLGPFSLEEINRKLADGTFAGTDLAWHEGAAGWAPLSGVAGVVLPSPAPASSPAVPPAAPSPTPAAAPPAPAPAAAPVRPSTPIVQRPASPGGYRTLSLVSWILLGLTLVLSFIPFIGCGTWFLAWPVAIAAIVMGIIVLTRGGTGQGIAIILAGVLIVPLSFLGQFASLTLVSHFSGDTQHKNQIRDNLRTIQNAKNQFVTETKAVEGAPVTMAALATQLSGKEIKPAVGESYDPMPVGKAPTATLPATKTLGKFNGGDVLTAEMIDKDSAISWYVNKTATGGNTALPAATPKATVAPASSPSPAALSPSPKPAVTISPKPTSSPRSLISPRQSVEPNEPPSSSARPSPSAKFAPRDGPRTSPRETPSQQEESSGPRQGKKFPGDSPSASPEEEEDE